MSAKGGIRFCYCVVAFVVKRRVWGAERLFVAKHLSMVDVNGYSDQLMTNWLC